MKIYTGYFSKLTFYRNKGLHPISIARFNPKYVKGVLQYLKLAPTAGMLKMSEQEYNRHFSTILRGLSPKEVIEELKYESGGKDIVLLCYESLGKRCHRHDVAKWFRDYGYDVQEFLDDSVKPDEGPQYIQQNLF